MLHKNHLIQAGDRDIESNYDNKPQRRHYPHEVDGAKNEWKALIIQGEEYNSAVRQMEKDYARNNQQFIK